MTPKGKQKPDSGGPEQGRDHADGKGAQSALAIEKTVQRGCNQSEVVKAGTVVIAGVILVKTSAKQACHEHAVHAFIMVQRSDGEIENAAYQRQQHNGGSGPLPLCIGERPDTLRTARFCPYINRLRFTSQRFSLLGRYSFHLLFQFLSAHTIYFSSHDEPAFCFSLCNSVSPCLRGVFWFAFISRAQLYTEDTRQYAP